MSRARGAATPAAPLIPRRDSVDFIRSELRNRRPAAPPLGFPPKSLTAGKESPPLRVTDTGSCTVPRFHGENPTTLVTLIRPPNTDSPPSVFLYAFSPIPLFSVRFEALRRRNVYIT